MAGYIHVHVHIVTIRFYLSLLYAAKVTPCGDPHGTTVTVEAKALSLREKRLW